MSTTHDEETRENEGAGAAPDVVEGAQALSPRERIRRAREAALEERLEEFDIPPYPELPDVRLVMLCRPLDGKQIEASGRAAVADRSGARVLAGSLDMLARACTGIYVKAPRHRRADDEGRVDLIAWLDDTDPAHPVTFGDERLAGALGFEDGGAGVAAVRETFARNDAAIIHVAQQYSTWARSTGSSVDRGLLGE